MRESSQEAVLMIGTDAISSYTIADGASQAKENKIKVG
jgi:hypothetical protein